MQIQIFFSLIFRLILTVNAGYFKLKGERTSLNSINLNKRSEEDIKYELTSLGNKAIFYAVKLSIGSNKQNVTLLLDTGSSDIWVQSVDNEYCLGLKEPPSSISVIYQGPSESSNLNQNSPTSNMLEKLEEEVEESLNSKFLSIINGFETVATASTLVSSKTSDYLTVPSIYNDNNFNCSVYGQFNKDESNSFIDTGKIIYSGYGDGSWIEGIYGIDSINFEEGFSLSNITIGVVNVSSNLNIGIFGIGLPESESLYQSGGLEYNNFQTILKSEGYIDTISYSIYLDVDDNCNILFGGIDINKFISKDLTILKLVPYKFKGFFDKDMELISITLNSVSFDDGQESTIIMEGLIASILDTGTSFSLITRDLFDSIIQGFKFIYNGELDKYLIEGKYLDEQKLLLNFQGVEISIPLRDLTIPVIYSNGTNTDLYMFTPDINEDNDYIILGDSFLRSIYFSIDFENFNVVIGQLNSNSTIEDIKEIKSGEIANATTALSYSTTYGYNGISTLGVINGHSHSGIWNWLINFFKLL